MPQRIELFFWATPNCWKITIALEEMALPYAVRPVAIGKGEQFEPAFLAISPNNRVPAIVDRDGAGSEPVAIFESGAILQYLGRKTGRFYPSEGRALLAATSWRVTIPSPTWRSIRGSAMSATSARTSAISRMWPRGSIASAHAPRCNAV